MCFCINLNFDFHLHQHQRLVFRMHCDDLLNLLIRQGIFVWKSKQRNVWETEKPVAVPATCQAHRSSQSPPASKFDKHQCVHPAKHVSPNNFLPTIYPLNACWLVHRLILTSQPNFGQITKVDYCQFLLKGTKSGQSSLQSTITPEICNTCFKQRVLVTLTRNPNESFDNS